MKQIRSNRFTVQDAVATLGSTVDVAWLRFAVRHLDYPEVEMDGDAIAHPGYVPIPDMVRELARGIAAGEVALQRCVACKECFDINVAEGIFGDYANLERFVCRPCAERLSAWEFWQNHV